MQPITDSKLLHHLDRVNGEYKPITADVFLTNYCNNRCSWCTYNRWELEEGSYMMRFEDFVKYTEKLLQIGVKGMILTGGGEPTINRDFDKITKYLESRSINYGINTNFNKLRYCKPDYLKVSLDGYDEESYEAIRGVRAYELVKRNIKTYAEWKKENSPNTNLGIQKVVTCPEDIGKFYEANEDLQVDYIVFRPIESTSGCYYHDPKKLDEAQKEIELIKELQEFDKRVVLNYKWNLLQKHFNKCSAHWAQIALDERGNVIYCCHKPYEVIGNIMDDDILDKYSKAKTNIQMCDVPCRLTAPNMFMDKIESEVQNENFI